MINGLRIILGPVGIWKWPARANGHDRGGRCPPGPPGTDGWLVPHTDCGLGMINGLRIILGLVGIWKRPGLWLMLHRLLWCRLRHLLWWTLRR